MLRDQLHLRSRKRRPWVSAHKCCGIEPVVLVGHELLKEAARASNGKERGRLLCVTVTQCVIVNRHVSMPHLYQTSVFHISECRECAQLAGKRYDDVDGEADARRKDEADHRTVKYFAR